MDYGGGDFDDWAGRECISAQHGRTDGSGLGTRHLGGRSLLGGVALYNRLLPQTKAG